MINAAGRALIRRWEGCLLDAYQCPAGKWTIGYGHTEGVTPGMAITQQRADQWLLQDIADAEAAVDYFVKVPLNENQRAALVSFTFNLGGANLRKSTLLRRLNAGFGDEVPEHMADWVKVGGAISQGLVARRAAEAELWSTP